MVLHGTDPPATLAPVAIMAPAPGRVRLLKPGDPWLAQTLETHVAVLGGWFAYNAG